MDYINKMNNLVQNLTVVENVEEFIPIYETDKGEKVVSGRELHQGLGVQRDFTDWIKQQLNSVDATEKDFSLLKGKTSEVGGRPTEEYILKLEIAKEICLVAGASPRANETLKQKSKAYRKYLIQFEEKHKNQISNLTEKQMLQLQILNGDEMERIGALKQYEGVITKPLIDTIEKQSDAINELKPHAEYAERVLEDKKTLLTPTQIAKDFGMAGKALNALLHDLGVQYKQNGQWLLYAKYQGKGYTGPYQPDIPNAKPQTRWTQAGKKFIHDILRKNGYKTVLESKQQQQRFDFN
nr:MAG TPA: antirepressor protein [Caudoviricetes sp.]